MRNSLTDTIKPAAGRFAAYLKRCRHALALLCACVFLLHLPMLHSVVPGIDTENIIAGPEGMYQSWLSIGRQGLVFTKYLLGNRIFNPFLASGLSLTLLLAACAAAFWLGEELTGRREGFRGESLLTFLFGMAVLSHPIVTEQLYFSLQSLELAFALLALELCLLLAHRWASEKDVLCLILCALLLLLPFSSYQAMVPLFIAAAATAVFLRSLRDSAPSVSVQLAYTLRMAAAFLIGFLLNQLVTALFFTSSSYLADQFSWRRLGFLAALRKPLAHVRDVYTGYGTYYFAEYGILCVVLAVVLIRSIFSGRPKLISDCRGTSENIPHSSPEKPGAPSAKKKNRLWQLFLLAAFYAAPFYMSVLLGERPVIRAQLVLPFSTGVTACLCAGLLLRKRTVPPAGKAAILLHRTGTLLLAVLILAAVWHQAAVTDRLYYTDSLRAQGDYTLACRLQDDIRKCTGDVDYNGTVVFLGRREAVRNASCVQGDVMGQSLFSWDTDAEPRYYYSNGRIHSFLQSLGVLWKSPDPEQIQTAAEYMDSMTCYPEEGSILLHDDMVIVKLSEE